MALSENVFQSTVQAGRNSCRLGVRIRRLRCTGPPPEPRFTRFSRRPNAPLSAPRRPRGASRRCCGLLRTCLDAVEHAQAGPRPCAHFHPAHAEGQFSGSRFPYWESSQLVAQGLKLKGCWRKRSPRLRRTPNTLNYWLVFRDLPGWPPRHRVPFLLHTRSPHTLTKVAGFPVSARQFYFAPRLAMPHGLLTCQLLCCSWPIWT